MGLAPVYILRYSYGYPLLAYPCRRYGTESTKAAIFAQVGLAVNPRICYSFVKVFPLSRCTLPPGCTVILFLVCRFSLSLSNSAQTLTST